MRKFIKQGNELTLYNAAGRYTWGWHPPFYPPSTHNPN